MSDTEKSGTGKGRRKKPLQARSRQLVSFMVEAGLKILEEEGPAALTTTRVAEVAGVSIGSVYQYFTNREGVVDAIYHRKLEMAWQEARYWKQDKTLENLVSFLIGKAVERHRTLLQLDPDFYKNRIADFNIKSHNPDADSRADSWLREVFESHRDEFGPGDLEHIIYLATAGITAILEHTVRNRPHYIFEDDFVAELKVFASSYLRMKGKGNEKSTASAYSGPRRFSG